MSKPLDFFRYENGVLTSEGVALDRLVEKTGTPVYVYSRTAFLSPLAAIQEGLKDVNPLICFAVKSCSNIAVLKLLGDAGAGMDIVSGGELQRALQAGVPPSRVVFSGVGKTDEEMEFALSLPEPIRSFNVESVPELQQLSEIASKKGVRAKIALRFNPDVNAKTHPYISTGLKKNKFGLNRKEILAIARRLKELPWIELHGISIHIGSQLVSLSPLKDAFERLRELIDKLEPMLPAPLEFVDLGGGLGITYRNEKPPTIAKYTELILRHFGPRAGLRHPL